MSVAVQRRPMSRSDFLAWAASQPGRFEYDGFGPAPMAGGAMAHDLIAGNLFAQLWQALRGGPCRPYTTNMRIDAADSIRFPDATVSCSPREPAATIARDPAVVFEVLSGSTGFTDMATKNAEYRDTPSILRYVMLNQHRVWATVFVREGNDWLGHVVSDPGTVLPMPEIGIGVKLGDLYDGVEFTPPPV